MSGSDAQAHGTVGRLCNCLMCQTTGGGLQKALPLLLPNQQIGLNLKAKKLIVTERSRR